MIWRRDEGRRRPAQARHQRPARRRTPTTRSNSTSKATSSSARTSSIYQGKGDQRTYQADRAYYDVRKDQFLALNAQLDLFAPGLVAPAKVKSPRIEQYHPLVPAPDGQLVASTLAAIQAEQTVTTGSRFANPGYRFTSRSIDITQVVDNRRPCADDRRRARSTSDDLTWRIDARQNFFYIGPVPVFYWPRFVVDADDLEPPLQGDHVRDQQLLRPAVPHRLQRLQPARPPAAARDRPLEPRRRLPERPRQEARPGHRARHRDRLVRPRPDQRPHRPVPQEQGRPRRAA